MPQGYPAEPPSLAISNARGFGDAKLAQLLERLKREVAALQGDFMLGHLVATAIDCATEMNQPEGLCAFCLGSMAAEQGTEAHQHLLRLPCFHAFHK